MKEVRQVGSKVYVVTKAQKRSEKNLIPVTAGPLTRWQKIKRSAIG